VTKIPDFPPTSVLSRTPTREGLKDLNAGMIDFQHDVQSDVVASQTLGGYEQRHVVGLPRHEIKVTRAIPDKSEFCYLSPADGVIVTMPDGERSRFQVQEVRIIHHNQQLMEEEVTLINFVGDSGKDPAGILDLQQAPQPVTAPMMDDAGQRMEKLAEGVVEEPGLEDEEELDLATELE